MTRPSVAVVAECFPNYRAAVLRELAASTEFDYHFLGSPAPLLPGYRTIIPGGTDRFTALRTVALGPLRWQRGLVGAVLSGRYHAVVMTGDWAFLSTWVTAALLRLTRRPVLFWTHGWTKPESGPRRHVRRLFYGLATGLLLYGERGRQLALWHGLAATRLHVVYNSLDLTAQLAAAQAASDRPVDQVGELLAQHFARPELPLVVSSFRLAPARAVDEAIRAVALLQSRESPVNYLVVGDGPDSQRLQRLAAELDAPVAFIGPCYDERVLAGIYQAAVASLAPRMVGLSALQSLAHGTVVVTCDSADDQTPEWEALRDGTSARFFPVGDVPAMADSIARCVEDAKNKDARKTRHRPELRAVLFETYHPAAHAERINSAVRISSGERDRPRDGIISRRILRDRKDSVARRRRPDIQRPQPR